MDVRDLVEAVLYRQRNPHYRYVSPPREDAGQYFIGAGIHGMEKLTMRPSHAEIDMIDRLLQMNASMVHPGPGRLSRIRTDTKLRASRANKLTKLEEIEMQMDKQAMSRKWPCPSENDNNNAPKKNVRFKEEKKQNTAPATTNSASFKEEKQRKPATAPQTSVICKEEKKRKAAPAPNMMVSLKEEKNQNIAPAPKIVSFKDEKKQNSAPAIKKGVSVNGAKNQTMEENKQSPAPAPKQTVSFKEKNRTTTHVPAKRLSFKEELKLTTKPNKSVSFIEETIQKHYYRRRSRCIVQRIGEWIGW